jgi:flagellar operon protein (TIGR03826 family)
MGLNIANCPRCGKIFAKGIKDVCPACVKDLEQEYEACVKYLRENRGATIKQVSDDTKVPVKQITKFIREGRISLYNAPNLAYPCEVCGILIREGGMCDQCRQRLAKDVNAIKEQHQQKLQEEIAKKQIPTYKIDKKN